MEGSGYGELGQLGFVPDAPPATCPFGLAGLVLVLFVEAGGVS